MNRFSLRIALLLAWVAAALLSGPVLAQSAFQHPHSFGNAEKWARIFDDPARDAWQKPAEVIRALGLAPDAAVADIGSGTGYFAVRLARAAYKGRVFGVDVEPDMVRYLSDRARKEGLANLVSVAGAPDDPRLPAAVDWILMVDVYHHVSDRDRYFRKLRAYLRPGGRIAIIDYRPNAPFGPAKSMRVSPDRVIAELKRAGYEIAAEHAFLPNQYFLIFRPT